jgi:RNA recognition motif-containing protein
MLEEAFSSYGEIASIYLPVDLQHGCKPKGFAFIRYISQRSANNAAQSMNGVNLGIGRNIEVSIIHQSHYWSQDESNTSFQKKRKE